MGGMGGEKGGQPTLGGKQRSDSRPETHKSTGSVDSSLLLSLFSLPHSLTSFRPARRQKPIQTARLLWLITWIVICCLVRPMRVSASEPKLGNYGILLDVLRTQVNTETFGWYEFALSPTGEYAAGMTGATEEVASRGLYLWDINQAPNSGALRIVQPTSRSFPSPARALYGAFALSPDGRRVAVFSPGKWQILSLPQLTLEKELPSAVLEGEAQVAWSQDSAYLATVYENESIVVYDLRKDTVFQKSISVYGPVMDVGNQWIVRVYPDKTGNVFVACRLNLENCRGYATPLEVTILKVMPNKRAVLMQTRSTQPEKYAFRLWRRQLDDTYLLDDKELALRANVDPIPLLISPGEKYVAFNSYVWDFATGKALQKYTDYDTVPLAWLHDDSYFVVLDEASFALNLYRVGQSMPLQTLDIAKDILNNRVEWLDINYSGLQGISQDGRWVIIRLGKAMLLIPIVYQ